MKSIPTIFVWDKVARTAINKPSRGCEWVFQSKGIATRKWDGVAILVENGKVFHRVEWREGERLPNGFIRLESPDPKRPHKAIPGWVPIPETFKTKPNGIDERALRESWLAKLDELTKIAWAKLDDQAEARRKAGKTNLLVNPYAPVQETRQRVLEVPNGTYELCGPKIRGNHERLQSHILFLHGAEVVRKVPRTFGELQKFLEKYDGEGIVWHNQQPNGVVQMAKIKRRDFGFFTRISKEDLEMAYGQPNKLDPVYIASTAGEEPVKEGTSAHAS